MRVQRQSPTNLSGFADTLQATLSGMAFADGIPVLSTPGENHGGCEKGCAVGTRKTVLAMDRAGEVILGDRSHPEREREHRQLSRQECDAKAGNVPPDLVRRQSATSGYYLR